MRKTPHTSLALEAWPTIDRRRWQKVFQSLQTPRANGRHHSTVRKNAIQGAYARWINWLSGRHPDLLLLTPSARIQPDIVEEYIMDQRRRMADISIRSAIYDIDVAVRLLDRNHRAPWIKPILAILKRERPNRRNKAGRIVPTGDLLDYGMQLMRQSRSKPPIKRTDAIAYRDGLIIALLSIRPLRLANFVSLSIGETIISRHQRVWLAIPATETKNRLNLEYPFPEQLRKPLDYYLKEVRPWFLGQAKRRKLPSTNSIWLSLWGRPMSRNTFGTMLTSRTLAKFGKAVNPHLFRDCLATSIAGSRPELTWATPLMLGHRSTLTSQISYTHNDPEYGQLAFLEHLKRLRSG